MTGLAGSPRRGTRAAVLVHAGCTPNQRGGDATDHADDARPIHNGERNTNV
jgi:hypothetical protein